jgi:hypothetical protein
MKTLLQNVVEIVWKHVRFLDLWFLLLIGSTAQMHFTFVSQVHYQTGKILQLHHEDDQFIKEIIGMVGELNGMVGQLNEAQNSNVAVPADEAAIRSRVKALEEALGNSPEKAVVGLTLRKDFDNLQERYKSDIAGDARRDEKVGRPLQMVPGPDGADCRRDRRRGGQQSLFQKGVKRPSPLSTGEGLANLPGSRGFNQINQTHEQEIRPRAGGQRC